MSERLEFYRRIDREKTYTIESAAEGHPFCEALLDFVARFELTSKKCLEIGSSKGLFQDFVENYTGVDVSPDLAHYYHKPFMVVDSAKLPFADQSFDAVWSYATHEHIPDIELALEEIVRVLRPGGVCFFAPAWHTRPWFADGLAVRPYGELSVGQKVRKALIPFRDATLIRWPKVLLRRAFHLTVHELTSRRPQPLRYKKLQANYETFWQSDSDACNSLDPFDAILWFQSRHFICHEYDNLFRALMVRAMGLIVQKPAE